jgi:endo-1,3-1,4-beta-glycanase ExoK
MFSESESWFPAIQRATRFAGRLGTILLTCACGSAAAPPVTPALSDSDASARDPHGNAGAGATGSDATSVDAALGRGSTAGRFDLAWEDQFDAFDPARWQLMTHSWDGNLAQFSQDNVSFAGGVASLHLTPAPGDVAKPFRGVEMRSLDTLTYGKVEARARFAGTSAVVSAVVLIYTPWPADDWNELDIEYLGRYRDKIQFNAQVYIGPPKVPPVATSVTPTPSEVIADVTADPSADFHVYGIEWTPTDARFMIDGEVKRTWTTYIDRMKRPENVLLTIWASSSASWAGPVQADTAPSQADYDWVRVYTWTQAVP